MSAVFYAGGALPARHRTYPEQFSLMEVERCDIYVGIFAHRYGSGITEAEYRRARERNIPCLIYFKDDTVPVPPGYLERDSAAMARSAAHEIQAADNSQRIEDYGTTVTEPLYE